MLPGTFTTIIGRRYLIQDVIGRGGMGAVYRAYDRLTGQIIALKRVITSEMDLSFSSSTDFIDFRVSLAQEFKLLASLRHPNIIAVLDYGFDNEREPYYTMELLQNAETILEAGIRAPMRLKIDLLVQMLQALAYLHRRGILHRDLKPANVLVENGTVKVLDFGLSVMREHAAQSEEMGVTSGTLGYMAPEVLMGHHATELSDLYGVGVIAYELFAERSLFDATDIGTLINHILYSQPDIDSLDISIPLAGVLSRLLSKDPADRYPSALAVIGALSKALDHNIYVETEATRESFLQAARFIGRERELEELSDSLTHAVDGSGAVWLIAGESGVGKSRLVDELRTRALVEGALVMQGYAVNTTGTPYQIWRPLLSWLPLLRDLSETEINIIRAIAPDIPTLPDTDTSTELDPQIAQKELLKLIRQTLEEHDQPILMILEDLHWAGSASLSLLEQMQGMVRELRLMVIASYRDDEKPELPRQFPLASLMKLSRLDEAQIVQLSEAMLGEAGSQPHVVDLLKRETEGNVFFIIEVIRTLAEEAGHLEQIGLMTLPQQVFAGGMWKIIQRRLRHVPDYAHGLLRLAAVSGREQDLRLLQTLAPQIDLDRWLLDCANAAVLEVMESKWRFTHDKLREGVLDGLVLSERQRLHAEVAAALEKLYGAAPDRVPALAYHWGMAEDDAKEAVYTRLAGEQSVRSGAYREAIAYLERALELVKKSERMTRINVMHKLAEAHLGVGGYARAQRLYRESIDLAEAAKLTSLKGESLYRLGDIAYAQGKLEDAKGFYSQSRDLFTRLNDKRGIARALNSLGNVAYDSGDTKTAKEFYAESLALTRESGGQWSMAGARRIQSSATPSMSRDTREMQGLLNTLDEHIETGDKQGIAATLYRLGEAARARGAVPEAREYFHKSAGSYREIDERIGMAKALNALSELALQLDDRNEARKHLHNALKAVREAEPELTLVVLLTIARYFQSGSSPERAVELLAFILYHPEVSDALQDRAEHLVFELQQEVEPTLREAVWERGKNLHLDTLTLEVLQAL
jgi:tetratricopeptide (TPR) repeat protein